MSLQLCNLGPLSTRWTEVSASVAVPPWDDGQMIGSMGSDEVVFPELGVAPLVALGTDLEDELPTPDGLLFSRERSLFRKLVLHLGA